MVKVKEESFKTCVNEIDGKLFLYVPLSRKSDRRRDTEYEGLSDNCNVNVYITWSVKEE